MIQNDHSIDERSIRVFSQSFTHAVHNYSAHMYVRSYTLPPYCEGIQYDSVIKINLSKQCNETFGNT